MTANKIYDVYQASSIECTLIEICHNDCLHLSYKFLSIISEPTPKVFIPNGLKQFGRKPFLGERCLYFHYFWVKGKITLPFRTLAFHLLGDGEVWKQRFFEIVFLCRINPITIIST